jgi:uncharacterized protein (TIGR00255 family)
MQSMTGYGKSVCELPGKTVAIEVKSLNSKQLDIYTRIPNLYKEKELEIRNTISRYLTRGKIEISITYENNDTNSTAKINIPLIKEYYSQLKDLTNELDPNEKEALLQTIMRFPDALKIDKEELDEKEWLKLSEKLIQALEGIKEFRVQEGEALKKDILKRVHTIRNLYKEITHFEKNRVSEIREKLKNSLVEVIDPEKVDENRFEQELVYYLEKVDITEEKVRLANHCDFFVEVANNSESIGKKLGFIAQEMGREINTIGSKANHTQIQRIVVQMKDELEKIKEQLMNVL